MAIETILPVTEVVLTVFDKPSPEQVDDANTGLVQYERDRLACGLSRGRRKLFCASAEPHTGNGGVSPYRGARRLAVLSAAHRGRLLAAGGRSAL